MKKRILSILLLCCMVLTLLPAPAFAADEETYALPPDTGGLCEHHPEHDEACGYIPKTAEIPQENEVKIAVLSGTQETVTVESVQAMIDALPEAKNINDDNIEEVKIQFQAVVDAMNQLTVREQNELDISRYMKVSSVLYGPWRDFFNPIPGTDIEWMLSSNDDETLTLTIIGQGEMPDFEDADSQACPWTNSKYAIKRVIIREGVTNIGNYAFNRDLLTKWRADPFCGKMVIGGMQHDGTPKQTNGNAFRRYRVTDSRNPPAAEDRADGIL